MRTIMHTEKMTGDNNKLNRSAISGSVRGKALGALNYEERPVNLTLYFY